MNQSVLQQWLDELLETSGQQWVLRLVVVASAAGAALAASAADERWWPAGIVLIAALAATSAMRPDTHVALLVVVAVVWRWVATVDRLDTVWLPVATVCLLTYHATIALSSTVPRGGVLPAATLGRWARKATLAGAATIVMWVLVVLLDSRDAPGNGLLTATALAGVAAAAVLIRARSLDVKR